MHYYQHHIGDFIKDTSFLTNEEVGIYMKLIWLYYDTENPLPKNIALLTAKVNARGKQDIVQNILDIFFYESEGYYCHNRCAQVIADYHKQLETASKAGKASAVKRKLNAQTATVQQESNDRSTTVQPTINQEPITINQEPVGGGGRVIEFKIANPPPASEFTYSSQKFSMYGDWTPSDSFETLAKIAGMKLGDDYPVDEFLEFRTYWVTQPNMQRTQGEWEHAFIKSYKIKQLKGTKK
jgi:uncharacterized protein YdaU (DUF1376 family)